MSLDLENRGENKGFLGVGHEKSGDAGRRKALVGEVVFGSAHVCVMGRETELILSVGHDRGGEAGRVNALM